MANSDGGDAPAPQTETATGQFAIQKIYVKDVSFESPNCPDTFRAQWQPTMDLQIHSDAKRVDEDLYEVVLAVTITAKLGETTAFLVEVHQAGLFTVSGMPEERLTPVLASFCPNILFPYAREAVSDLVTRGGFPPVLLAPVNFDAIYAEQAARERAGDDGQSSEAAH